MSRPGVLGFGAAHGQDGNACPSMYLGHFCFRPICTSAAHPRSPPLSGSIQLGDDVRAALGLPKLGHSMVDLRTASPDELRAELSRRVTKRVDDRLMSGDPW